MTQTLARVAGLTLVLLASVAGWAAPARADRDIVYSAQYYRWSGKYYRGDYGVPPEQTLQDLGPYHLYRIDPDGTGRTRLTAGSHDDYEPRWSPDGKQILFIRVQADEKASLCLIGAGGGRLATLFRFPRRDWIWSLRCSWSPDNRRVAFTTRDYSAEHSEWRLYVLDTNRGTILRKLEGVTGSSWSPDGRRLYVSRERDGDQILDLASGKQVRVAHPLWNPLWLDRTSILGYVPEPSRSTDYLEVLRVVDHQGMVRRRVGLDLSRARGDGANPEPGCTTLYRIRAGSPLLLVETRWNMSDGEHPWCHRVDLRTGAWRTLTEGAFLGLSPGGERFAVANHEWVGPYKRGGQRVGALRIVSLKTGKARAITPRLVSIAGGDWRR